ncbi:Gaa1-like protein [Infundibulicybe gibba]|nr:Gaa1-like protein [Infundibulicybe gibba]
MANVPQPTNPLRRGISRIKEIIKPRDTEARIRRKEAMVSVLYNRLPALKLLLLVIGYLWMLAIPSPYLGRRTYFDENALQPGQVTTYWSWGEVNVADRYLEQLETIVAANLTSQQRAEFLRNEFETMGLLASTQNYKYSASIGTTEGTNAYAVSHSPRTSGTEAMVISASWLSRAGEGDGTLNLRGVSTVLALAKFLKGSSLWAKDFVFIISDGYMEGMHAWLSEYHGSSQQNLRADHLGLTSGVIWTALNIDYPGHSFSHLGVFYEGLNGRLPNQDLLNSFVSIARFTGGVPVVVYDHLDPRDHPVARDQLENIPLWVPRALRDHPDVREYAHRAKNVLRHVAYQARGQASGVHGLFHQFRIDAITIFAVPASGPHGFHAIGRIIESTLRTMNNLLERLHASFFFYILTDFEQFLKIGSYLPSAVLLSVAMMFTGLGLWVDAGWLRDHKTTEKADAASVGWTRRERPVIPALGIMLSTHVLGLVLFLVVSSPMFMQNRVLFSPMLLMVLAISPLMLFSGNFSKPNASSLAIVLKALNLCLASTVISITTVLNFSLAATTAATLAIPLSLSSSSSHRSIRGVKYFGYTFLALGWLVFGQEEMWQAIWNWEI